LKLSLLAATEKTTGRPIFATAQIAGPGHCTTTFVLIRTLDLSNRFPLFADLV